MLGTSVVTAYVRSGRTTLQCDTPYAGVISNPEQIDSHEFSAVDAELVGVIIDEIEPSGASFGTEWRVLGNDGSVFRAWGTVKTTVVGPLVASGSPYRIEVRDFNQDDTGNYGIHLQRLPAATACENLPLGCDATQTGSVEDAFDTDLLSFEATDGELVGVIIDEVEPSGASFGTQWRVLRSDGSALQGWSTAKTTDVGPLAASDSPYRIEVHDHYHDDIGTYGVHIQRLVAAAACESLPLDCDVMLTGSIEDAFDTDLLSFDAVDGELVSMIIDEIEPSGASFGTQWRLLRGDGSALQGWTTAKTTDVGPLVASDSPYRIEVHDYYHDDIGTYGVHIQRLPAATACETVWAVPGLPTVGTIDTPFDTDLVGFTPDDGNSVEIAVEVIDPSGGSFGAQWRVIQGDGTTVLSWRTASYASLESLAASEGPYRVEVRDYLHSDTGTYRITLNETTGLQPDGIPPTGFLARAGVSPNPMGQDTTLRFALREPGHAVLKVFDLSGRLVDTVLDRELEPGIHDVPWTSDSVAGGVYFFRLTVGAESFTTRLVHVR
jgi:hypothetical protein